MGREELQTVGVDSSSKKHYCKWEQRNGVVAGQVHRVKGVFFNGKIMSCSMLIGIVE